ncbi:iron ABC transporter permease [bacterium]|nr:iron ABC transporter permease [bacterium]
MPIKRPVLGIVLLLLVFIGSLLLLPFLGLEVISPQEVLSGTSDRVNQIFWYLRVPRVLTGVLVGSVLALAGLTFQAVFQNPLATPFTLGTASGASLGASLYIWTGWSISLLGIQGITLFAFLGALLALGVVYGFSQLKDGMSTTTMLLAGVAVSIFFSSLILLIQYLSDQAHSLRILRWLMGGLEAVGYGRLLEPLPFAVVGMLLIFYHRWDLNLLAIGEDLAASRGVDVKRTKIMLLLVAGLMVGAVVAIAGPVGFVGLMIPHICRLWLGSDHRVLIIAAILMGGIFLPWCDTLARVIVAPAELPVGIITALLGGPFFLWMLVRQKR